MGGLSSGVREVAEQHPSPFNREAHLLSECLRSILFFFFFKMLGISVYICWMDKLTWWVQRILGESRCLTNNWAVKDFAEDFSNLQLPKACYLSNLLTTVLCYFLSSGIRLKDIIMYLDCGPIKESKNLICSSCLPQKSWQESSTCLKIK